MGFGILTKFSAIVPYLQIILKLFQSSVEFEAAKPHSFCVKYTLSFFTESLTIELWNLLLIPHVTEVYALKLTCLFMGTKSILVSDMDFK